MQTESLISVIQPEVMASEKDEKRLCRMVRLWEKLTADEQRRFRRHIEGVLLLSFEAELIPTVQVAKILKTSFYRVKQMVEDGTLAPAEVRREQAFPWREGKVLGYLFRRTDIEDYALQLKLGVKEK